MKSIIKMIMKFTFVAVFLIAGIAHAQQPRNVHNLQPNGQSLSANISNGSGFNYQVRTTSAGTLVVETAGSTDTYMIAYDSNMRQLATNDDGGSGFNARIQLQVNANETYYFNVTGLNTSTNGAFSISASMSGGASVSSTELRMNQTYSGYINSGETLYFRVRLETDPYYEISWDDRDRQHYGSLNNAADIRVGIRREDSSSFIVPIADSGNFNGNYSSYSNQHRVYSPSSSNTPRFDTNTWYIIVVEATYGGGNFRLNIF